MGLPGCGQRCLQSLDVFQDTGDLETNPLYFQAQALLFGGEVTGINTGQFVALLDGVTFLYGSSLFRIGKFNRLQARDVFILLLETV